MVDILDPEMARLLAERAAITHSIYELLRSNAQGGTFGPENALQRIKIEKLRDDLALINWQLGSRDAQLNGTSALFGRTVTYRRQSDPKYDVESNNVIDAQ